MEPKVVLDPALTSQEAGIRRRSTGGGRSPRAHASYLGRLPEGRAILPRFPAALVGAGSACRGILCPPGNWAAVASG